MYAIRSYYAEYTSLSSLCTQEEAKRAIEKSHLSITEWRDKSFQSTEFFVKMTKKLEKSQNAPLGLHLLMGKTAKIKFQNIAKNLEEDRIAIIQGKATKTP